MLLSASESAAAPVAPIWLFCKLQEGQRCSEAAGTGRARATYESVLSVALLLLSAFESAAAPASPIWLSFRLLRG